VRQSRWLDSFHRDVLSKNHLIINVAGSQCRGGTRYHGAERRGYNFAEFKTWLLVNGSVFSNPPQRFNTSTRSLGEMCR
jgi:hypothetical protein